VGSNLSAAEQQSFCFIVNFGQLFSGNLSAVASLLRFRPPWPGQSQLILERCCGCWPAALFCRSQEDEDAAAELTVQIL